MKIGQKLSEIETHTLAPENFGLMRVFQCKGKGSPLKLGFLGEREQLARFDLIKEMQSRVKYCP